MAIAWSFFGGVVVRYAFPVLRMTSHKRSRRRCSDVAAAWRIRYRPCYVALVTPRCPGRRQAPISTSPLCMGCRGRSLPCIVALLSSAPPVVRTTTQQRTGSNQIRDSDGLRPTMGWAGLNFFQKTMKVCDYCTLQITKNSITGILPHQN